MVKTKTKKRSTKSATARRSMPGARMSSQAVAAQEADSVYFLKLVLYLILGSVWIRLTRGGMSVPLPIGMVIGLLLARTDKLAFDRKIAYAILLVSMFIGFWLPLGLEFVLS